MGMIMYAVLHDCDPFTAGLVRKMDQVVPYFVMMVAKDVPGLPGLYIAGLFSAGLSTVSGGLNGISCMVYDDFLKERYVPEHLYIL